MDKRYQIKKEKGQNMHGLYFKGEILRYEYTKQELKEYANSHARQLAHEAEMARIKNGIMSPSQRQIQDKIDALNTSGLLRVLADRFVWGISHAKILDLEVEEIFGKFYGGGISESFGWTVKRNGKIYKRGLSYVRMINLLYAYVK